MGKKINLTFIVETRKQDSTLTEEVNKFITQLFPVMEGIEVKDIKLSFEKFPPDPVSRATRVSDASSDIENAISEIESVKEELEDWKGNLPEQFEEKADELETAIDELDSAISSAQEAVDSLGNAVANRTTKQWKYNAHLIAAAPNMYKALKFFVARNTSEYTNLDRGIGVATVIGKSFLDARKALAKAEGK